MRGKLSRTFRSLQVHNYRLFAAGQLVKLIGVWAMFTAQDWLVLKLSGDSATALGIVTSLQFAPMLLLTLVGGRLADRYDKRKLLVVVNAWWGTFSLVLAFLVASGLVQLWHVFVTAGLLGAANAIETPVRQSFASELVGTRLLPNALALSAATFNSARITGPALAGVLIAGLGLGPVFVISALASLSPLVSLTRMRPGELHRVALPARAPAKIVDGLRYVWHHGDLVLPMSLIAVVGMLGFNFQITLAALAKTVFHTGAASFGLFTTALAAGALVGALAGTGRRSRPGIYVVLGAGVAFGALETMVGLAPAYWMVVTLLVPTGFFMMYFAQAANQRIQLGTEAAYRGRVMALYVLVFVGTTPIGAPLVGWCAERFGPASAIWLGGLASLLAAAVALGWQLRRTGERLRLRVHRLPLVYVIRAAGPEAAPVAPAALRRRRRSRAFAPAAPHRVDAGVTTPRTGVGGPRAAGSSRPASARRESVAVVTQDA